MLQEQVLQEQVLEDQVLQDQVVQEQVLQEHQVLQDQQHPSNSSTPTNQHIPSSRQKNRDQPEGSSATPASSPHASGGRDLELEEDLQVSSILGFAKTVNTNNFFPARKLSDLGPSMCRVQYFGLGVVSAVPRQHWIPYSEEAQIRVSEANSQNEASFGLAMEKLLATKARIERDGVDELDFAVEVQETSSSGTVQQARAVARQLTKLNRVSVQNSEQLTAAAMSRYIVEQEHQVFLCRECPDFKADVLVKAERHARSHGQLKRKAAKRSMDKIHLCSKPGCDQKFARVSQLDLHYRTEHQVQGGGYKCWPCSFTYTRPVLLRNWKNYVKHLRTTKAHNRAAVLELKCPYCDFTTSTVRGWNMARHQRKRHGPHKMVLSLLDDILNKMFGADQDEDEEAVDDVGMEEDVENIEEEEKDMEEVEEDMEEEEENMSEEEEDMEEEEKEEGLVPEGNEIDTDVVLRPKTAVDVQIKCLEVLSFAGQISDYEKMKLMNLREQRQQLINFGLVAEKESFAQPQVRSKKRKGAEVVGVVGIRRSVRNIPSSAEGEQELQVLLDREETQQEEDIEMDQSQQDVEQGTEPDTVTQEEDTEEPEDEADAATDPAFRFVCGVCGAYGSNREVNLLRHVTDVHTTRDYSFPCTRCLEEFPTYFEMNAHRKTCLLLCCLTSPCYTDCTWSTTWHGYMPAHKRGHLDRIRRMQD